MRRARRIVLFSVVVLLSVVTVSSAGFFSWLRGKEGKKVEGAILMVVPLKYTVIELGLNISKIREAQIVSYEAAEGEAPPFLHVWDPAPRQWVRINLDEYLAGSVFSEPPGMTYLIGSADEVPAELTTAPAGCMQIRHIPQLDPVTIVNTINEDIDFRSSEWKWLAEQHGLEVKDLNYELRKYGRYGKPGEEKTVPMPGDVMDVEPVPVEGVEAAPPAGAGDVVETRVPAPPLPDPEAVEKKGADILPEDK